LVRIYDRDAWLVYKSGLYTLLWKWLVPRCFYFYVNWDGIGVRSTLTIDRGRRKGAGFAYKLIQSVIFSHVLSTSLPYVFLHRFAKAKCHAIFSDGDLNSRHIVYLNVYQNLMLTALKMHEYLRDWGIGSWINYSFLRGKHIQQLSHY
jgi:telomerase reverse transcriptase